MRVSKQQQIEFRDKLTTEKATRESIKEEIKAKRIPQTDIAKGINYSLSSVNNNLTGDLTSYKVLYLINRYIKGHTNPKWAVNIKVHNRNLTWLTQNGFSTSESIAILA